MMPGRGAALGWRPSSQGVVSALILVFCGVLVLYPMVYLVVLSVNVGDPQTFPPDEYGIEHYRDLFESWRVIANTAFVACIATVMAILIGFLAAWALTRTQLPGVAWLERLMQLPYYMTPLVGALAWSILAAPRTGFLNQLWHTVGGSGDLFNANELSIRYGLGIIATLVFLLSAFAGGLFGFTAMLPYI